MLLAQLLIDVRMLEVIVLAAGRGTRMKSDLPKVLHPIGGKPMVARVLDTARQLGAERVHLVVVTAHRRLPMLLPRRMLKSMFNLSS